MITEYVGEIIRPQVADQREVRYQAEGKEMYFFALDLERIIDATEAGSCVSTHASAAAVAYDCV